MREETRGAGILSGVVAGALLTVALIAVLYLVTQAAGMPFVPFDVFDWVGRLLPGPVITFGIDLIVSVLTTLRLGELSSAAKAAEQFMAVAGLFVTGAIAGAVVFAIARRVGQSRALLVGLAVGLVVGVPVLLISLTVNRSASADRVVSSLWTLISFGIWGALIGRVYRRLTVTPADPVMAAAEQIDRRRFLVTLGGATAAITIAGTGVGVLLGRSRSEDVLVESGVASANQPWSEANALPNADDPVRPAPGTRPEFTSLESHYRIDINTVPPVVKEEGWKLVIDGLVDNPLALTLDQVRSGYEPMDQFVTLACISNWIGGELIGTTRWTGVSLQKLLAEARPQAGATHLKLTSADNFDEYVALEAIASDERVMLTYAWDGLPLEVKHGFPLRIYIPNRYGMKQPKWITRIEAVAEEGEGYWVRRGWDKDALMRATSVIDTVATDAVVTGADGQKLVPIGGIAHAGDRSIARVDVRVDEGEWTPAQLRGPLADTTWVIWRYDWPFQAGAHTFYVRCVDGNNEPQIETVADVRPSGATGIDSYRVDI